MGNMSALDWVSYWLVVIGALNWGLVGFFDFNLVSTIFGASIVTSIVYMLVGLSAVYALFTMKKCKK